MDILAAKKKNSGENVASVEKTEISKQILSRDKVFRKMSNYDFFSHIRDLQIRSEVVKSLWGHASCSLSELDKWISMCDKNQYTKFAEKKITFT